MTLYTRRGRRRGGVYGCLFVRTQPTRGRGRQWSLWEPGMPMKLEFTSGPFLSHAEDGTEILITTAVHAEAPHAPWSDFLVAYDAKTLSLRYTKRLSQVAHNNDRHELLAVSDKHVLLHDRHWNIRSLRAGDGERVGSVRTPEKPLPPACPRGKDVVVALGESSDHDHPVVAIDPGKPALSVMPSVKYWPTNCFASCSEDSIAAACEENLTYDHESYLPPKLPPEEHKQWLDRHYEFWARSVGAEFGVGYKASGTHVPFAMRLDRPSLKISWRVELPGPYDRGGRFTGPPVVIDRKMIIPYERGGCRLAALSIDSGELLWERTAECEGMRILSSRVYGLAERNRSIPVLDLRTGSPVGIVLAPAVTP